MTDKGYSFEIAENKIELETLRSCDRPHQNTETNYGAFDVNSMDEDSLLAVALDEPYKNFNFQFSKESTEALEISFNTCVYNISSGSSWTKSAS